MLRHKVVARVILAVALAALLVSCAVAADDSASLNGGGVKVDLKEQLEKGLKARRPVEFAYIAQVVALVESGELPRPLVTSTFGWARHKPQRQLQYFQFALQSRAKKIGVKTPNLDNQTVGTAASGGQHGFGNP